jgi:methylenetetrahydrofolate dehydrogenase (NADP+)/methenyltetrahydrofolate cyclohydrolase
MILIEGKQVAEKRREKIVEKLKELKGTPSFAVIRVGDDPASEIYIRIKRKMCEELGINFTEYHLEKDVTQEALLDVIKKLNDDKSVHAILLQSPIPYHLDIMQAFEAIDPNKDVDGFSPVNTGRLVQGQPSFKACTPYGIMMLLDEYGISVEGKNCVVIGRSNIVGKPMAELLLNANGTITICHSKTKNLSEITKTADILVVAIGSPNFITGDMIKEDAVVIDVGINRIPGTNKIVGDVDFESAKNKASYITPVPGGVGPMTIIALMENIIKAYELQNK